MRRLGWFIAGATAGAGAMRMARRRVRSAARQLSPRHVRDRVEQRVRSKVDEVGDAIREGRAAKVNRERQLRAVIDHRAESMTDHVGPGDTVLVDGEPVDAGRVILLRDRADSSNSV